MDKTRKTELITDYKTKEGDAGSTEVQVALITERIAQLTTHMAAHRKEGVERRACVLAVRIAAA